MIYVHTAGNQFFTRLAFAIQAAIPPEYETQIVGQPIDAPYNQPDDLFIFNWMSWNNDRDIDHRVHNYMVYNTEILPYKGPLNPRYLEFLDKAIAVYDYSNTNVSYRPNSIYLPLGYSPTWDTTEFDILFYGSHSPARGEILEALEKAGLRVYAHYGLMPETELQRVIGLTKLVISTPWTDGWLNDSARIIPLMCSNVPVLAERTGDKEWWDWADQYPNVTVVDRDKIVETALKILYREPFVFPIPEKPWLKS
jgi:hypothetical protein